MSDAKVELKHYPTESVYAVAIWVPTFGEPRGEWHSFGYGPGDGYGTAYGALNAAEAYMAGAKNMARLLSAGSVSSNAAGFLARASEARKIDGEASA